MAIYTLGYSSANGGLLIENTEADLEYSDNSTQVLTLAQGFAGLTPGAPVMSIKLNNVIPLLGPEFDFISYFLTKQAFEYRFQLGGAGKKIVCPVTYVIGPVTLSTAIGKTTEFGVTLITAAQPLS